MGFLDKNSTFCTIKEAADRSGLAEIYIRKLARAGRIPMLKAGRIYRINYPAFMEQVSTMSMPTNKNGGDHHDASK